MRISNISQYLGGADNVIAREIIEGDQHVFQFQLGNNIDFSGYTFEVDTELFQANVTKRGSSIRIDSFNKYNSNLVNEGRLQLPSDITNQDLGGVFVNTTDPTRANLVIPSTLLSNLTTDNAPIDTTTPLVVVMSVSLTSGGQPRVTQSFRMLWVIRYRPMA